MRHAISWNEKSPGTTGVQEIFLCFGGAFSFILSRSSDGPFYLFKHTNNILMPNINRSPCFWTIAYIRNIGYALL